MMSLWRRIGIAVGLVEPTWIEKWVLALRALRWEGQIVSGYRSPADQATIERIASAAAAEPGSIFDWTEECPNDFPRRTWPAVVGEGRGEVFRLEQFRPRPRRR